MSLLVNMLSRLVITFLPRSNCLLISWLQSPFAVILEPKKIKSDTVSTVAPSICHEVMGPDAMIFLFWMLSFKPTFSLSTFTFIKRLFSSSSPSAELTHWKRLWCWKGLGAGGEEDDSGWDGWMASPTRWAWVWVNSGSWWWTGKPGVLQFTGLQRVGHNWATELTDWLIEKTRRN